MAIIASGVQGRLYAKRRTAHAQTALHILMLRHAGPTVCVRGARTKVCARAPMRRAQVAPGPHHNTLAHILTRTVRIASGVQAHTCALHRKQHV